MSGTGEATEFKFGRNIHRVHPNKSPLKISELWERERVRGLPNFWVPPIISGTGKYANYKFGRNIQRVHQNKIPVKMLEKIEHERIKGLPNFWYPSYLMNR